MTDGTREIETGAGSGTGTGSRSPGDLHVHVMPIPVLLLVFAILVVLTLLTVAATRFDLGDLNIWIALLIAVAKAGVVALYFMHLRYDKPFHGVVLVVSFLFVALFIGVSLMDTREYQRDVEASSSGQAGG